MSASGIELTLRTLLRSANSRTTELLGVALHAPEGEVGDTLRVGALRALIMRSDAASHRLVVDSFAELPPDLQAVVAETTPHSPLAASIPGMIAPAVPRRARHASEVAVAVGVTGALPAVVEAVSWPDGQYAAAFAYDALCLAERLADEMAAYNPQVGPDEHERPEDPAFARRAAVNALSRALDRFGDHGQYELLEALLLLTPRDEPSLIQALQNPAHPAHDALLLSLRTSHSRGTLGVLAGVMADLGAPQNLLEIAAERADRAGLATLFELIGYPVGLRVRENCHRLKTFAWLEPGRMAVLADLPGDAQAAAVQLAAASQAPRERVADVVMLLLRSGHPTARLAACRAIDALPETDAAGPLGDAIASDDSRVVANAVRLLRPKSFPEAMRVLIGMLAHPDFIVRESAGRCLRELSMSAFRDHLDELPEDVRREVGRLVGKADPMGQSLLRSELSSGAYGRRLRALELVDLTDLAGPLTDSLVGLVENDQDIGVRCEAARLLGGVEPSERVLDALVEAVSASAGAVRDAARASLERLSGQPLSIPTGAAP